MAKQPAEKNSPKPAAKKAKAAAKKPKPTAVAPKPTARRKPPPVPPRVYTLAVSLMSGPLTEAFLKKNRSVVRTIAIRGDQTLEALHECIFAAFGRDDPHMYEFQMGKGPMDPKGPRYVLPMAAGDDDGPPILGTVDTTTIDSMNLKVGRKFGYWFDFGDDWHHQIDVEAIAVGPSTGRYPRVVSKVGASPPQYVDWDGEE